MISPHGESGERSGYPAPWEAPDGVATDIAAFLTKGRPTATLYHTDYPTDIHTIIAEPDQASLIHEP